MAGNQVSKERKIEWLKRMYLSRAFEEMAEQLYAMGKIHGTMHLSMGMEASAIGSVAAIEKGDYVLGTHRGHSEMIGFGADINRMMAEFLGKADGYCGGRGGSMHIADQKNGFLGAQGIIGANPPLAVGVGLSIRNRKSGQVCLCYFGDGTTNEGGFHEGLNMAGIWKLPVVFICENNQYGMSMPINQAVAIDKLSDRAACYGMPGVTVDGNDVMAVYEATQAAVERARAGDGPTLVENVTYRWRGHSKSDANRYRTKEEIQRWMEADRDPIARWQRYLIESGILGEDGIQNIEEEAYSIIDEAVEYAENSPEPDLETIERGVYAE